MSNATEQARSTRSDARAFADAFAAADDAFTFGPVPGESRTLDLSELPDVIALDRPVALPAPDAVRGVAHTSSLDADDDDQLLTLDQLGDALARPARHADDLDFDFGTSAHERARRRTAARLDASPSARRRASGPASGARHADASRPGAPRTADGTPSRGPAPAGPRPRFARDQALPARDTVADASASAAELLAVPGGRFTRSAAEPLELPGRGARRTAAVAARPGARPAAGARLREVQRDRAPREAVVERFRANPDRIAMWAVLLGILLVLIAFSSGSAGAIALPLVAAL